MCVGVWDTYAYGDEDIFRGLTPWEEDAYSRCVTPGQRLCLIGCGTGRDLLPLIDRGHDVVGVEVSRPSVARLRQILIERTSTATVIEGSIEDVELPGVFDAVLFTHSCFGYVQGKQHRVAVLRKAIAHLMPNGRMLIFYVARTGTWNTTSVSLARLAGRVTRSDWRVEPFDVIEVLRIHGKPCLTYEHMFSFDELQAEVEQAGLRVLEHHAVPWTIPYVILGRA